jgi:ABC-type lipoprotein release transport system permease subunit
MSTTTGRTAVPPGGNTPGQRATVAPLYRLAWRNLWRQRRRTLLLVIVVGYATLGIIFFWGFTDGFLTSIVTGQARFVAAPGLITTSAYHDDPDPENALANLDAIDRALDAPQVRGAAPRLDFPALIRSAYATEGVQARGVDPALEGQVSGIPDAVADGRMIEGPGEVVLGAGLAEKIDVLLGERIAIDVASTAGPQAAGLIVVGLVRSSIELIDDTTVLVHLDQARELTGVATATGIALDIPFGREQAAADAINPRLDADTRAYPIDELLGSLAQGLSAERAQTIPLGLIFSIFAAVTVTSTVVVSVLERTREFGIIISLGLDQNRLSWLITLEAIYATLIGFVVGLGLGYGLLWLLNSFNVLGPLMTNIYGDFLAGFGLSDEIFASLSAEYLIYAAVTVALAGIFAALAPAQRIRNLNPSEAMRSE